MAGIFDGKWLFETEKNIHLFQVAPIYMIRHDQDKINNRMTYRCLNCNNGVQIDLGLDKPIHGARVECPTCKDAKLMAHVNLNLN